MNIRLLALYGALTVAAHAQTVIGGPMTLNVTARTATVAWIVEDGRVELRTAGAAPKAASSFKVEKTTFTGLQPNTRYDYTIAGGATGWFKTALQGPGNYNFVVYGDTRTRHDVHRRVITELLKHGVPDFIVNTGDQVEDANDNSLWPFFFDIEKDLLRQTVFYPLLGNHERNSPNYYEIFQTRKAYYSFDWGNAHFSILNSDLTNVGTTQAERDQYWAEETRWLEDDLATHQNTSFRFVIAHQPPFTAVARRQGDNPHMIALVPTLEKYRVTAGFFGHDHNYQHYLNNGIHYVVSGGGGAPLYDVDKPPPGITQKVESVENFIKLNVEGTIAHVQTIAIDGRTLDQFDIQGTAPPPARNTKQ
jgi:acid phosphatase type 7